MSRPHTQPLHMYHPGDIRPGSINAILGVAKQVPCDARLTADEARELYDYVNHLEAHPRGIRLLREGKLEIV